MTEITMPRLSDSMEQGTIASWLKANGEHVDAGDELVEIETDKATMTYDAPAAGTLEIIAAEGSALAVGETMARLAMAPADGAAPVVPASPRHGATVDVAPVPTRAVPTNGSAAAAAVRATPL